MGYWSTRGLRGSTLEDMINTTNEMYLKHNLCIVQKIPTPITVTKIGSKKRIITEAYFESKSSVDYIGVVQGIPICFDAKEIKQKSLPLQNIHEHQIQFMNNFVNQKGVSFLIVYFSSFNETYLLPFEVLNKYYVEKSNGGRKSIPYSAFEEEYLISNKLGYIVHYLETLNKYLENYNY